MLQRLPTWGGIHETFYYTIYPTSQLTQTNSLLETLWLSQTFTSVVTDADGDGPGKEGRETFFLTDTQLARFTVIPKNTNTVFSTYAYTWNLTNWW
jgi:hypothetical protein